MTETARSTRGSDLALIPANAGAGAAGKDLAVAVEADVGGVGPADDETAILHAHKRDEEPNAARARHEHLCGAKRRRMEKSKTEKEFHEDNAVDSCKSRAES